MAVSDPAFDLTGQDFRRDWVRLRTLLILRWLAIIGQTFTVMIAHFYLGLQIELGLCFLAIGASVLLNVIAMAMFPQNQHLGDRDAMLMLMFDVAQLGFLLFLTGGLNNPFALLILAPVTISAAALSLQSTLILDAFAVVMVTGLAFFHAPLVSTTGEVLALPDLFVVGFWISISIGIFFLSAYAHRITSETHWMSQALLATQMALSREQKLTDLGGVVAAAAHELGTPLATIKLVSTELAEDLRDHPDYAQDLQLLRDQADRCRDILRSMGRIGKNDLHVRSAPFQAIVREAAEPHETRGIAMKYDFSGEHKTLDEQPIMWRKPEIIYGLRNLIQNAVDFAHETIWIEGRWTKHEIRLRITDDGVGYPPDLLGRLGDPFLRHRSWDTDIVRPGYEGMGLGLFIAKTLLARSGAKIRFWNAPQPFFIGKDRIEKGGAVVEVIWPYARVGLLDEEMAAPLSENQPIEA